MNRLLVLLALLMTGCGCETVNAGHVGVVTRFGAVEPRPIPEGFNWVNVFAHVVDVNVQTVPMTAEATGASKDLQTVHTKVTVQYAPAADKATCLVQKFGGDDGAWSLGILEPGIQEIVKAVSARYTAEELVTKRAEVKQGVEESLNAFVAQTLHARGCDGGIRIANVAITNFDFSHEFNASIEAKVKAEQDALRAENEKHKRITEAEAAAKEKTLAADSIAYETDVESKARAAAIKREADALTASSNLIQLRIAERWDGKLPTYTGNSIPLLQLK
jgi:prohibitin 2